MLFGQDRDQLRTFYCKAWESQRQGKPLQPLQAQIVSVIEKHPEYQAMLEKPEQALGREYLPELGETPTPDELEWVKGFIAHRTWREAVTYRETAPHEYTVRGWEDGTQANEDFNRFAMSIRRFGHADFYYKLRHIYWVVDTFKYWTMQWGTSTQSIGWHFHDII